MRLSLRACLAVPLLVFSLCARADPGCYRIAMIDQAPDVDLDKALGELLYREAGLCVTLMRVPTERLKRMLDKGDVDGVVVRTLEFIRAQSGMERGRAAPSPVINSAETGAICRG